MTFNPEKLKSPRQSLRANLAVPMESLDRLYKNVSDDVLKDK